MDDYEQDWNPTENNGVTLTDNHTARYVKIGQMVHLYFDVTVSPNSNGNAFDLSNLPYASINSDDTPYGGFVTYANYSGSEIRLQFTTQTRATFYIGTTSIKLNQAGRLQICWTNSLHNLGLKNDTYQTNHHRQN